MARILICDDEAGIRRVLKRYARFEGHEVTEAENGEEAVVLCRSHSYDIIIMDIMMPKMDGFTTVLKIRETLDTPVIMLSARSESYDKIAGFEAGADDYVQKPFSAKEIMLRIQAILRRNSQSKKDNCDENGHIVFENKGLRADLTAYQVLIDGIEKRMAPKEYDLLFFLIRNKNIAVPRERILEEIWGYKDVADDRTLDTHMKLLRKTLGEYGDIIKTIRGLGYRLDG